MEEPDNQRSIPEPSGDVKGTPHSRYVQRPSNRPSDLRPATLPLPTIDFGLLLSSPSETAKLDSALRTHGLFHLVHHGLPTPLLDRLLSSAREFFSNGEGYDQDPVVNDDQVLDWCRRLLLIVQPEKERKVDLWPSLLKDMLLEYHEECKVVAKKVLMAKGEALGLGSSYLEDVVGDEQSVMVRLNSYPRCERPDLVVGMKAHKDASAITLVLQDPEVNGGLHRLDGGGEWVEIPVVPGALLVNIGDEIEIKSNGIYKSPMHRVVTGAEKERVSVVLFYRSGDDKEIGPAEALVGEERPRRYRDVILKDYLDSAWSSFAMGKNLIDSVKI